MTTTARLVLTDCKAALAELETDPVDQAWRLKWITAVALLRAVGHALDSVDVETSREMKDAIKTAYKRWQAQKPAYPLFWGFIQKERNNVLKEYRFGGQQRMPIEIPGSHIESQPIYVMKRSRYRYRDPRDLVREAIAWWETELDAIDEAAAKAQ